MEKAIEQLQNSANELDKISAGTNIALTEMRVQFETLVEMQKEERIEIQKMHNETIEKIENRHAKDIAHWKHIVIGLILVIALIFGGIVGTIAYILANFDVEFGYTQSVGIGGDGSHIINDGIHYNRTD